MHFRVALTVLALAGCTMANYGPAQGQGSYQYLNSGASAHGLEEYVNAATGGVQQHGSQSLTSAAEIQPSPSEAAGLRHAQAQLQALNANPTYRNLQNSDAIAESLAESNLAANIRQGKISVVAPNVVDQSLYRSLLVPTGNNNQVIATQPLPPIIVNQPGAPPAHVSSGPPAVVKAAPVIYKIKPSVIYQQEVINKVPTPLSLNPVYVKVYKPGKQIDAPVAPVVAPVFNQAGPFGGNAGGAFGGNAAGAFGGNAGGAFGGNAGGAFGGNAGGAFGGNAAGPFGGNAAGPFGGNPSAVAADSYSAAGNGAQLFSSPGAPQSHGGSHNHAGSYNHAASYSPVGSYSSAGSYN